MSPEDTASMETRDGWCSYDNSILHWGLKHSHIARFVNTIEVARIFQQGRSGMLLPPHLKMYLKGNGRPLLIADKGIPI